MIAQASFALRGRNPDILTCIANLSNDEVFTPPEFANRMLDTLAESWSASHGGASIWADPSVTFLDPCTKSGVFLREITTRLTEGLARKMPDLGRRVDHILTKQVFGIGITRLTSLMARRSLYCSKVANGTHSVARSFADEAGNVAFPRVDHTWDGERCRYCGAGKSVFDRPEGLERHAYAFIHGEDARATLGSLFGGRMQFDVIIGNPPYQLDDGGFGASALPIYNRFVDQAKALEPRFLTMVIPSRWFFGGRGLDDFRKAMLTDNRTRRLVDYPDSRDVFQKVDVAGGICYFLWERDNPGGCAVLAHEPGAPPTEVVRPLLEDGADIFVRSNNAIPILRKIFAVERQTGTERFELPEARRFDVQVSSQKPFGLRTFFRGVDTRSERNDLLVIQSGGRAWTARSEIASGVDLIDKWKVFTSKSSSEHAGQVDKNGQRRVLSLSGVIPPGSVVTETYILLGAFDNEEEARNCYSYVITRFFRFLISVRSSAQDLSRSAYSFIPIQDFTRPWNDHDLVEKYRLSQIEVEYIERLIRPMSAVDD